MPIRVFLADAHELVRTSLRFYLESQPNITVVGEASNGRDAVATVAKLRPELAILDLSMPELNGIEATRQIVTEHIPTQVIILSDHASRHQIHQALSAGARGYVVKQASANELIQAIHSVAEGQRFLCSKVQNELIEDYIAHPHQEVENALEILNEQDRTILQLVADGRSTIQIGHLLNLSPKTIDSYRSRLMKKLNIHDIAGLVKFAIQHELISL